jgi:ADP-heptose:LPS heptosyltransferase
MVDLWSLQSESICPLPLALLTDRSIGDMVCSMAALQILAARYEQIVVTTNIPQLLGPMSPPNANHHLGWMPYHSQCEVFNVSVGSSMNPRYGHPIKQILDHLGIESPAQIPQPTWNEKTMNARFVNGAWDVSPIAYPKYDFLIHANSDDDARRWPFDQWAALIGALLEEYPGCSIGILGSDHVPPWNHHKPDPRPFGHTDSTFSAVCSPTRSALIRDAKEDGSAPRSGVEYVYNRSFALVGSLVKRAKRAVITIDSSVSRIAHAVGAKNHVLLCPDAYPEEWSSHPGCYNVVGNPQTWSVYDVMQKVKCANDGCPLGYAMPPTRIVDARALWELRHLCSTWSAWPREGNITLRLVGGFGAVGHEVDLTRLTEEQNDKLVSLATAANIFESVSWTGGVF